MQESERSDGLLVSYMVGQRSAAQHDYTMVMMTATVCDGVSVDSVRGLSDVTGAYAGLVQLVRVGEACVSMCCGAVAMPVAMWAAGYELCVCCSLCMWRCVCVASRLLSLCLPLYFGLYFHQQTRHRNTTLTHTRHLIGTRGTEFDTTCPSHASSLLDDLRCHCKKYDTGRISQSSPHST